MDELRQRNVILSVRDLACAGCAASLRGLLMQARGVQSAEVSFEEGRAVVEYDAQLTDAGLLIDLMRDAGYAVERSTVSGFATG